MCCRYTLLKEHLQPLLQKLGVLLATGTVPTSRYNIPPGGPIFAVRNGAQPSPIQSNLLGYSGSTSSPPRELVSLHWGFVPSWAHDAAHPVVNARAETLAEKPTFRDALRSRRCLIPASGFYEWKVIGRTRQPWLFRLHDERPFALAGLWETWHAPDGSTRESCAVVTSAPNALMEPIHHRMPVMLADPAAWNDWLDPRIDRLDTLNRHLAPFPAEAMTATAVSPRVNNIRHEGPDCVAPAGSTNDPHVDPQFSLGL